MDRAASNKEGSYICVKFLKLFVKIIIFLFVIFFICS